MKIRCQKKQKSKCVAHVPLAKPGPRPPPPAAAAAQQKTSFLSEKNRTEGSGVRHESPLLGAYAAPRKTPSKFKEKKKLRRERLQVQGSNNRTFQGHRIEKMDTKKLLKKVPAIERGEF